MLSVLSTTALYPFLAFKTAALFALINSFSLDKS